MTNRYPDEKDAKPSPEPRDEKAAKVAEPSEIGEELTDSETASIDAGLNPQPLPPRTAAHE